MNEQLQDFLNDCIDKWRNPFLEFTWWIVTFSCHSDCIDIICHQSKDKVWFTYSYHDLFSIESWIMEFVKWKQTWIALPWNLWHYMNMCQMTWEKKVKYFLENALLPN